MLFDGIIPIFHILFDGIIPIFEARNERKSPLCLHECLKISSFASDKITSVSALVVMTHKIRKRRQSWNTT
jgi:hypothetical protein